MVEKFYEELFFLLDFGEWRGRGYFRNIYFLFGLMEFLKKCKFLGEGVFSGGGDFVFFGK